MGKIKYGFLTTVESNMKSFVYPVVKNLDKEIFDPVMMCSMSDAFIKQYSDDCKCISIGIERGFHFFNLIKTIVELKRVFDKEKFDIVQYGTENAAFCGAIAAWLSKIPIRIYEHWGARYVGYSGFMREVSKLIERTAAFFSTDVRQVSMENMELCIKDKIYKSEKVKVLGKGGTVGVDFSQFDVSKRAVYSKEIREKYKISESAIVFGYVGRIQRDKGINELLESFKQISLKENDIFLLLVGAIDDANPINPDLMAWANQCDKVKFVGFVSDTYKYMSSFDILVHPTYREGFGMVLQEAAAVKTPIITTDIMGPREYINNWVTGILVPPKNVKALKDEMLKLVDDMPLRDTLAINNYEYTKEHFERSVMVNRIMNDRYGLLQRAGLIKGEK